LRGKTPVCSRTRHRVSDLMEKETLSIGKHSPMEKLSWKHSPWPDDNAKGAARDSRAAPLVRNCPRSFRSFSFQSVLLWK
jgi:hypothetical protein